MNTKIEPLTESEREALFTRARELSVSRDSAILETVVGRILAARLSDRTESLAQAIEADANEPKGSRNHRAYAGHFAAIVRSTPWAPSS